MKRNILKTLTLAATIVVALMQSAVAAPRLQPLPVEQQARFGATHCIELAAADLAGVTYSNIAWAVTNTVTKPCAVRFVAYLLDQPFNNTKAYDTNGVMTTTNSITLSCGDGNSATKWISGLQVAADQTPTVVGSFGTDYTATITGLATNVTGITVTSPTLNAQTSDVKLILTLTPSGSEAQLGSLTRGKARFFFRIIGAGMQVQ